MAVIEITAKVDLDAATAAKWFCDLDDEKQADFLIEVAKQARSWNGYPGQQWYLVGRHLRTCSCSNDDARNVVRELHNGLGDEA